MRLSPWPPTCPPSPFCIVHLSEKRSRPMLGACGRCHTPTGRPSPTRLFQTSVPLDSSCSTRRPAAGCSEHLKLCGRQQVGSLASIDGGVDYEQQYEGGVQCTLYIVTTIVSGMTRMEEVYITGLLAEKAGLAHSDLAHLWTLNPIRLDFVSRKRFPENQPETCTGLCGPS